MQSNWQLGQIDFDETMVMNTELLRQYQAEAEIFKALAHPTRLFIVHTIREQKLSVKELSNMVGIDISTMSKHLDILKKQKIIVGVKEKNSVFYFLNMPCVLDSVSCVKNVTDNR